jgi:NitT/TauT family transport system substrate-binding protein
VVLLLVGVSHRADAAELKTWRHAILKAKSDAGFMMMVTKGFAEKQGLKLEIVQVKSEVVGLKALLSGDVDSYDGSPGNVIVAASRGAGIKIVGCHWPGLPHGIFVKDSINSAQDLKGKSIAISAPGALPDLLARALLAQNHISPNDVHFANLGGDTDRFKALVAGVVDAAVVSGEYAPIAAKEHVKQLVRASDILPNYMRVCFVTSDKNLATRHADVVHFLAAQMNALHYAATHKKETLALTRAITHEKPDDPRPAYMYDEALRNHWVDPTLGLPMKKLQCMQEQSVRSGIQPHLVDLKTVVDPEPRQEALKLAGK